MTYSWSYIHEINGLDFVSLISYRSNWNIDVSPPDFLKRYKIINKLLTSFVKSSKTILFSLGLLPVFTPDDTARAPVSVIEVLNTVLSPTEAICSGYIAYSYNSETLKKSIKSLKGGLT